MQCSVLSSFSYHIDINAKGDTFQSALGNSIQVTITPQMYQAIFPCCDLLKGVTKF